MSTPKYVRITMARRGPNRTFYARVVNPEIPSEGSITVVVVNRYGEELDEYNGEAFVYDIDKSKTSAIEPMHINERSRMLMLGAEPQPIAAMEAVGVQPTITVQVFSPKDKPEPGERIVVHVPELQRGDNDGVYFGKYLHDLGEWRIEGSNNGWEIDWWYRHPIPRTGIFSATSFS